MPDTTPHKPTVASRAEVSALTSFGNTQEEIAKYLGICIDTLAKYYRHELDTAAVTANAKVARCLFSKAVDQDDLSAQIFWLKTRGRWKTADQDKEADKSPAEAVLAQIITGKVTITHND